MRHVLGILALLCGCGGSDTYNDDAAADAAAAIDARPSDVAATMCATSGVSATA